MKIIFKPRHILNKTLGTVIIGAIDSEKRSLADYQCLGVNDEQVIQEAINNLPDGGGVIYFLEGHYVKSNTTGISVPNNVELIASEASFFSLTNHLNADACFYTNSDQNNGNTGINIIGGHYDCNFRNQSSTTYQYLFDFDNVTQSIIDTHITNFTMLEGKKKTSSILFNNRKFNTQTKIFNNCNSINEFNIIDGSATIETGTGRLGDDCLNITVNTNTTIIHEVPPQFADDFEAYNIEFEIKFTDISKISKMVFGAEYGVDSGCDELSPVIDPTVSGRPEDIVKLFKSNRWVTIKVPLNFYYNNNIPYWKFEVTSTESTTVLINNIRFVGVNKSTPNLIWTFDDALGSESPSPTLPGIKILNQYGHRGTVSQMGRTLIDEEYLTKDDLDAICFEYGWDISVHSPTHLESNISLELAWNTIIDIKKFCQENGWKGHGYHIFAGHDTRGEITDAFKKLFSCFRNPLQQFPIVIKNNSVETSRQITSTIINNAEKSLLRRHGVLHHYSHGLGGTQISEAQLISWCEFWYDWGLISEPASEALAEYSESWVSTDVNY